MHTHDPNTSEPRAEPFLRWCGGKTRILPALLIHFPKKIDFYYEPFLGGGAAFFALQHVRDIQQSLLSDNNLHLIETYRVVRSLPEELIEYYNRVYGKVADHKAAYSLARAAHNANIGVVRSTIPGWNPVADAARFIYLNAAGYNGLYRVNLKGRLNIPFGDRDPTPLDADNIRRASVALQSATLLSTSYHTILATLSKSKTPHPTTVYCDPPYHGGFQDYSPQRFNDNAHRDLAKAVGMLGLAGVHAVVSNSYTDLTRELYPKHVVIRNKQAISGKTKGRGATKELIATFPAV